MALRRAAALIACALLATLFSRDAGAVTQTYVDSAAFLLDLPGAPTVVNFDAEASGTVVSTGASIGGITFVYAFASGPGNRLAVTDGSAFGAGGFDTTSAANAIGTEDLDVLQEGDDLTLLIGAASAIGLFVISSEDPGVSLFDGDIQLAAGSQVAVLDVDAVEQTLPSGSRVYFLGVIDTVTSFTSADLASSNLPGGAGGQFLYNVDDVMMLPEPGISGLVAGILALFCLGRPCRR